MKPNLFFFSLFFMCLSLSSFLWSQSPGVKAFGLFENGKFEEAILAFSEVMENGSEADYYYSLYYRGYCHYQLENFEEATQDLENVQEVPATNEWYIWLMDNSNLLLSRIVDKQGDKPKAKKYLLRAMSYNPGQSSHYSNLGLLELEMGNEQNAVQALKKAVKLEDDNAFAWNNYALVLLEVGKLKKAMQAVEKSLWLNPTNPYAYKNRALIFIAEGEYESACADLVKCQEKNTTSSTKITGLVDLKEINKLLERHCN